MRRRHRHIEIARFLDRFAAIESFRDSEFTSAILEQAGDAEKVLGALRAGHPAPDGFERTARGPAGGVDVGRAGEGDLREFSSVRRIDGREIFSRPGRDKLPIDKEVVARLQLRVRRLGRGIVTP